ncbi:MAG TPA: hypothetical protein VFZ09_10680 [Archangium sp.]|uniref:hypothetical protein n=1 Tax=Archangium sp. TaxID=1872627 RepID=UPI002E35D7F1|nr:hypothetical protein [Archangium sp.]HEX5746703.1 hypothetical protein [Archangium sp.]
MPSLRHEALLELFRNRPVLAAELLRDALGIELPAYAEARAESAELTEAVPTEYRADLVVQLWGDTPRLAIVVEVQLSPDEEKRYTWPVYLTHMRAKLRCPTVLLVVAPDAGVARWCGQPLETGHRGFVLKPYLAGPESIPVITRPEQARQAVELMVLSAMAHGQGEQGAAIAETVLPGLAGIDEERARFYFDLVMWSLNDAARTALEALMSSGTYEYQSEFARRYFTQGRQEGKADALLEVLDARGLQVDEQSRQRITACTELAQLERWLRKAVSVQSVQELFAS